MHDNIAVLNFSDQVCKSVIRKLRAERICCRILNSSACLEDIQKDMPAGIILASECNGTDGVQFDNRILQAGIPILALGDTSITMARLLGGTTAEQGVTEAGLSEIRFAQNLLTEGIDDQERKMDTYVPVVPGGGIVPLCVSNGSMIGYSHEIMPVYGIQLPIEQNDPDTSMFLRNFAVSVCKCRNDWDDMKAIEQIQESVCALAGNGDAVCLLTGGLGSTVSAVAAYQIIGSRLKCFYIETGLRREDEWLQLRNMAEKTGMNVECIDKSKEIMLRLAGIYNPYEKKRLIEECIEETLYEQIINMPDVALLIRGTDRDDIIQGNVLHIPLSVCEKYTVFEPVNELFSDDLQRLADLIGLPPEMCTNQPLPSTGLALRIQGLVCSEKIEILKTCDDILNDEINKAGIKRLYRYFSFLSDAGSKYYIYLRAVQVGEGESALTARLPYDLLERAVGRIMASCQKVERVLYDLTPSADYSRIEFK
ncbi:MAG: hypothetical protein CW338_01805 [Clostridiales bacterium]|nr:hypothetical protein [Clostridiales bacterium]